MRGSTLRTGLLGLVPLGLMLLAGPVAAEGKLPIDAPKAPELKAPDLKPPDLKPPDLKPPDAKPPDLKPPGEGGDPGAPQQDAAPDEAGGLPPQLAGNATGSAVPIEEADDQSTLTLEEIVNRLVTTASRRSEGSLSAPAWIITLTAEDLRERGYRELSDLLDDLPGMDVVRPWGDTYYKVYWRGYRNTIGSPFLLLLDGVVFNHLWLNETEILAAFPITDVDRVEIVYGPASAVYGPNAAMGVINVITRKDEKSAGTHLRTRVSLSAPQHSFRFTDTTKTADVNALYKGDGFRISVTGRFDMGVLDPSLGDRFEWLKSQYSADPKLWGDLTQYSGIAGSFRSPSEKESLDARLFVGGTEAAVQMFRMENGSGLSYPADKLQSRELYTMVERDLYLRHTQAIGQSLTSTSLLRYRESNVDPPTTDVERTPAGQITFQYWESANRAFSLNQDFALDAGHNLFADEDALALNFGFNLERRDLEKAYVVSGGNQYWDPSVPFTNNGTGKTFQFPSPLSASDDVQNRSQVGVVGAYLLSRYQFLKNHSIDLGLRIDYNGILDEVDPTFRGGYVGKFIDKLTVKLLYGQAVQEPTWRELFGAWNGTGANPGLRSEHSQTLELDAGYNLDWLAVYGDAYYVLYRDAIISTTSSGQNLGRRQVVGADLSATAIIPVPNVRQLRVWAYLSDYVLARQSDPSGSKVMTPIGDLAKYRIWAGATLELNPVVSFTALGRCAAARHPVSTNPLGTIPPYCSVDANLLLRDLFTDGLSLSLRVTNLLDQQYVEPGIAEADSGDTPGKWQGSTWAGSAGYYNSWLPQPGRAVMLQLSLDL